MNPINTNSKTVANLTIEDLDSTIRVITYAANREENNQVVIMGKLDSVLHDPLGPPIYNQETNEPTGNYGVPVNQLKISGQFFSFTHDTVVELW